MRLELRGGDEPDDEEVDILIRSHQDMAGHHLLRNAAEDDRQRIGRSRRGRTRVTPIAVADAREQPRPVEPVEAAPHVVLERGAIERAAHRPSRQQHPGGVLQARRHERRQPPPVGPFRGRLPVVPRQHLGQRSPIPVAERPAKPRQEVEGGGHQHGHARSGGRRSARAAANRQEAAGADPRQQIVEAPAAGEPADHRRHLVGMRRQGRVDGGRGIRLAKPAEGPEVPPALGPAIQLVEDEGT